MGYVALLLRLRAPTVSTAIASQHAMGLFVRPLAIDAHRRGGGRHLVPCPRNSGRGHGPHLQCRLHATVNGYIANKKVRSGESMHSA